MLWCIDAWALPTTTDMFCYMGSEQNPDLIRGAASRIITSMIHDTENLDSADHANSARDHSEPLGSLPVKHYGLNNILNDILARNLYSDIKKDNGSAKGSTPKKDNSSSLGRKSDKTEIELHCFVERRAVGEGDKKGDKY
jgi:hypothetical protein